LSAQLGAASAGLKLPGMAGFAAGMCSLTNQFCLSMAGNAKKYCLFSMVNKFFPQAALASGLLCVG